MHGRLPSCREWIAKGCSLEADILPPCREFAVGKTYIKNCFNERVMEKAFERRDYRLGPGASDAADRKKLPASGLITVYRDDPALTEILDPILAELGTSRGVFAARDTKGHFAQFKVDDWCQAKMKVEAEREGGRHADGAKRAPA